MKNKKFFGGKITAKVADKMEELKDYGGFWLFSKGFFRYSLYVLLRPKYRFHKWHLSPLEWRPYALEIIRYVNSYPLKEKADTVVEIGCGTGDILAGIKAGRKTGVDTEEEVIRLARLIHPDASFEKGSFENIKGKEIDFLITVNFIHGIEPEKLAENYNFLLRNNKIKYIVLDSVRYQYDCDFDRLFGNLASKTKKVYEKGGFKSGRKILVYKIINES